MFSFGLGGEGRLGLGDDAWRVRPTLVHLSSSSTSSPRTPCRPPSCPPLIGRFRRLPPEFALAFSMATHQRLGGGCAFFGLLPELVGRILEACTSWPRARAAEMPGLVRLLGGGVGV